ncbi:TonB-dependent receptor [Rhodohalobacter sp. SW132]|uniref:SusC/RagA family TonB-linked outer membrane protein n=1 Tax=Rhodohalobacter sp. SW132 TaxID=2293433 RepID=UPI00131502B7|nr:TonB-dependent receptor [Rhodohalobacter sp. SW132]
MFAQHQVRGTVTDNATEEPLPGVNIVIEGTTIGTSTGVDGQYQLNVPSSDQVLIFSYIGYQTQEIAIDGRSEINVSLSEIELVGEDLVVVGYGTQRRRDVTGSVSRVSGERISRIATQSVDQALQGVAAGVQVTPSSGAPGAGSVIRIRGVGTLGDASPLFVVDGMTTDNINYLNPNDIESVDILKDASATAIYGARGANGVILITTNRSNLERPAEFNINYYRGFQNVARTVPVTNAREYAMLANEVALNEGGTPPFSDPDQFGDGTDWQDEIFRTAPIQNLNISASGGTASTSYNISGSYSSQDGIIRENYLDRISLRLNNEYYITDDFQIGHNLALVYESYQNAPGVVGSAYRGDPTIPVFTEDGAYSPTDARASVGNPVAQFEYDSNNENSRNRIMGNVFLNYYFLDNFQFRSNFGLDTNRVEGRSFSPIFFVSAIQNSEQTSLNVFNNFTTNILWENTLQYQQQFQDHRVEALVGYTVEEFSTENLAGSRIGIVGDDPSLWYLNSGDDSEGVTNTNTAGEWGMESLLGRINYNLLERYLLTATIRRDGSSRFGADNRYGWFPSFALGWIISDEPFMPQTNWITQLKIRGSWGITGNDKIDFYPGVPTVSGNLNAIFGPGEDVHFGALPINLANPQIRWEETTQFNIGVELDLIDSRLRGEFEYYDRVTDGILVRVPIPSYVGATPSPFVNAAEVKNHGLELTLNWRDTHGDFMYSFGVNATTINNEVLSLGRGNEDIFGGGVGVGGMLATRTIVGQPIGSFYGYKMDGIFQNQSEIDAGPTMGNEQPGDIRFTDFTGDGQITTDDRTFLGSPIPDYLFSFNMEFDYRGFDFSAALTGQYGNEIYNAKKQARFGTPNFEESALNRWTGEGTTNSYPRITNGGHNYNVSDFFIEDGSFLKLQSLTLGYTLDASLTNQLGLRNLRVYANGNNLFTLTGYDGYTPEITSGSVIASGIDSAFYPFARTITFGISASF